MKKQAGFAPILLVLVIVVILAVGGGFFFMKTKGSTSPLTTIVSNALPKQLNDKCDYQDPDICKFINSFSESKSVEISSVLTAQDGKKTETRFAQTDGTKSQIVMSENGKESWNTITIGDTTYTKDYSDNKWWKQTTKKGNDTLKNKIEFKINLTTTPEPSVKPVLDTYKKLGKEACGKLQCFKYQVISADGTDSTQFIWFDDREYQLRKTRSEEKNGSVDVSEYRYDGLSINAPSPVKEATDDQVILPGGSSVQMTDEEKKQIEEIQKSMKESVQNEQQPSTQNTDTSSGGEEAY